MRHQSQPPTRGRGFALGEGSREHRQPGPVGLLGGLPGDRRPPASRRGLPGAVPASHAAASLEDHDPVDAHLDEVADHAVDLVALREALMDLDAGAGRRGHRALEDLGADGGRRDRREPGICDRAPAVGDPDKVAGGGPADNGEVAGILALDGQVRGGEDSRLSEEKRAVPAHWEPSLCGEG